MTVEIDDAYEQDIQKILDEYGISLGHFMTQAVLNHINACNMNEERLVKKSDDYCTYQILKNETIGIRAALDYNKIPYRIYKSDSCFLWNIDVYLNEKDFNYIREISKNHIRDYPEKSHCEVVDE